MILIEVKSNDIIDSIQVRVLNEKTTLDENEIFQSLLVDISRCLVELEEIKEKTALIDLTEEQSNILRKTLFNYGVLGFVEKSLYKETLGDLRYF
ncbi:hypothetical protein HY498_05215 [Candidatus Woesearchaeota archaeon]|nr:hypothetical protein [Candidatus Woesearchaeota archaeon]